MTMQVGMMASDGIVLASDTRWSSSGSACRHSYSASKIKIDTTCRMAVTCAADMIAANRVAEGILSILPNLRGEEWQRREELIEEVGNRLAGDHEVQCIVAFVDPAPEIYSLSCSQSQDIFSYIRIFDRVPAGDTANAAVFCSERYYEKLPVNQLMRLAAYQVVAAPRFNSARICGLELVFSDDTGFHRVPEAECLQMEADSKKRARDIGELILRG